MQDLTVFFEIFSDEDVSVRDRPEDASRIGSVDANAVNGQRFIANNSSAQRMAKENTAEIPLLQWHLQALISIRGAAFNCENAGYQ